MQQDNDTPAAPSPFRLGPRRSRGSRARERGCPRPYPPLFFWGGSDPHAARPIAYGSLWITPKTPKVYLNKTDTQLMKRRTVKGNVMSRPRKITDAQLRAARALSVTGITPEKIVVTLGLTCSPRALRRALATEAVSQRAPKARVAPTSLRDREVGSEAPGPTSEPLDLPSEIEILEELVGQLRSTLQRAEVSFSDRARLSSALAHIVKQRALAIRSIETSVGFVSEAASRVRAKLDVLRDQDERANETAIENETEVSRVAS